MKHRGSRWLFVLLAGLLAIVPSGANTVAPVRYRLSFPDLAHHVARVEATFPSLGPGPLDLRMSRASPGRYSLHDFAKNVFGVRAFGDDGRELALTRSDPYGWRVEAHDGTVRVVYDVFGDRIDGTDLAIDTTHAHINMPAAIMWARGLDERPALVTIEPPAGREWRVATQLFSGATPFEFSAPNLQYLMDSPIEVGPIALASFTVDGRTIRVAAHQTGTADELAAFVRDVERIVREQGRIYGEYPDFEPRHYTFLADYLPYAQDDGMEHRNSTVVTSSRSIASDRVRLLGTVAHEFFHAWNVERIRPRSLEPFDFERANFSGELWLAEGFTQYYGTLTLSRTRLADQASTLSALVEFVSNVTLNPARRLRSAVETSQLATFTDSEQAADRSNPATAAISYYQFGGAIALALDLSLRERSSGRTTLDDYMRALWRSHGRPGGSRPGYVDHPYTLADLEARLADVAGSESFARDFFAQFVAGHEIADYTRLLKQAGLVLRRPRANEAWIGDTEMAAGPRGVRLTSHPARGTPLYAAGVDRDDDLVELGDVRLTTVTQLDEVLRRQRPGDTLPLVVADRAGVQRRSVITLSENPALDLVPVEALGGRLTASAGAFRQAWLGSH